MDELGIKIISDIDCHFANDPEINEYDIIPSFGSLTNRSPVFVVDHKMAIESWAAGIMVSTASACLARFQSNIRAKFSVENIRELLSMTRAVLLVVADHMTAWNFRKQLVEQKYLEIKEDIALCDLIVYKHRKTPETFTHRRWLLQQLLPDDRCATQVCSRCRADDEHGGAQTSWKNHRSTWASARPLSSDTSLHSDSRHSAVRHELEVCAETADRYPNNYHAWSHRLWVVEHLACCLHQVIGDELASLDLFVARHVSDHSGFHYRQFLFNCILVSRVEQQPQPSELGTVAADEYRCRLHAELHLTAELNELYPGHEAIWYHRRFVIHKMARSCFARCPSSISTSLEPSSANNGEPNGVIIDVGRSVTRATREENLGDVDSVLSEEIAFCERLLADQRIDRLPWQRILIERHIAWTKRLQWDKR